MFNLLLLFWAVLLKIQSAVGTPAASVAENHTEWQGYFRGHAVDGAAVLYDLHRERYVCCDSARCAERFTPASTFKIMNALVALETGVIPDENYVLRWDGTRHDNQTWNQDHTLRSAMRYSVVWYYQELARRIGRIRMQHFIDTVGYGNREIGKRIDTFWLDGSLQISPREQVDFVRRLYEGSLPFSRATIEIVKDILILEKTESFVLRAKTGWGMRGAKNVGWFVGYIEEAGNVVFFATNIESGKPRDDFGAARIAITRDILGTLGLLRK